MSYFNTMMPGGVVGGASGGGGGAGAVGANWNSTSYSTTNVADGVVTTINKYGIQLQEGADITLGNVSLKQFIEETQSRLAMLTANRAMEAEWAELKRLGDEYRQLEAEIKDKMKIWEILKTSDENDKPQAL